LQNSQNKIAPPERRKENTFFHGVFFLDTDVKKQKSTSKSPNYIP
jgi:hypothetical protein